jgi:hypothetical protein
MFWRTSILVLVLAAAAAADDAKVKAKASLALRAEVMKVTAVAATGLATACPRGAPCDGTCCDDLEAKLAKAAAAKDPQPFVIWVAATPTPATVKALPGWTHCRVAEYKSDGKGDRPRAVVSVAKAGVFYRVGVFDITAKPEELKDVARKGVP